MPSEADLPSDEPESTGDEVRRYTRFARAWRTWVGDVDDLYRLARECQKLYEKSARLHKRRRQASVTRTRKGKDGPGQSTEGPMVIHGEFTLTSNDAKPGFEMTVLDGPDRVSGPIDAVMTELDRRTVDKVSITGTVSENDMLSVSLRRTSRSDWSAVEVKVESEDAGWAREALAHLSEQIDRAQPKWAWMHSRTGVRLFELVNLLVLSIPVSAIHATTGWSAEFVPLLTFWALFALIVVIATGRPILRWLLPPLEVLRPGGSPKGSKFIVYLTMAIVGFIGSVVASVVT